MYICVASGRIQHWALALAAYEYTIAAFRPTDKHSNADTLSRLPLQTQPTHTHMPVELVLLLSKLLATFGTNPLVDTKRS